MKTRTISPKLRAELELAQFAILRRQVPLLYAVLTINTCVLCFSVYGRVSPILSIGVTAAFLTFALIRLIVWLRRSQRSPTAAIVSRSLRNTTAIAAVVSLILGVWGVTLLKSAVSEEPFVPLFIAFGSIACAYCLASLPRAASVTIVFAAGPVILTLLASGSPIQVASGVNLLLIFGLILRLISDHINFLLEMVQTHANMRELAYTDTLTGLPNRRALMRRLRAITRGRLGDPNALMAMIDLDGFKAINDTYGHHGGDVILVEAARRMAAAAGASTFVARLGGDEFAIVATNADATIPVEAFGRQLLETLEAPFFVGETTLRLSASIGIALCPEDAGDADDLLRRADLAMYAVKRGSRKGAARYATHMEHDAGRRLAIEQALRETQPPAALSLVYQPVFDVTDGTIRSFEALARWIHPQLGEIGPMEFIEVAEQTGLICDLSERLFAEAIHEAATWPSTIGLSLNLSGVQLSNPTTMLMIMSLLHRHGVDPRRLEIEVTETSLLADFEAAREQLGLLQATGIQVVLDDFGSGYASIAYLKRIPFQRVKIDGELIADIVTSAQARHLLEGTLLLCRAIGAPATAERIESEAQLQILRDLGCDRVQGYLLGRPGDRDATRSLIRSVAEGELLDDGAATAAHLGWAGGDPPVAPRLLPL